MFNLMLITNEPELAEYAVNSGVKRIFIDIERNGKYERQGHLDTLISQHTLDDVASIKRVIGNNELLVRLNPHYSGSKDEIEKAISLGADIIMLPMFTDVRQVQSFSRMIDGRAKLIPLVETVAAVSCLDEVVRTSGVSEIYIGLNDLHRDKQNKFMFEPLVDGSVESMADIIKAQGLTFGFGGIARIGEGILPSELILAEHVRLGSSCVILSRTFHRRSKTLSDLGNNMCLEEEVQKIIKTRAFLSKRDARQMSKDKEKVASLVMSIVNGELQ